MPAEASHETERQRGPSRVASVAYIVIGAVAAIIIAASAARAVSTGAVVVAASLAGIATALAAQVRRSRVSLVLGAVLGFGIAWAFPQTRDSVLAIALGGLLGVAVGVALPTRRRWATPSSATAIVTTAVVVLVAATAWTGANSPSVDWFGQTVSHGPRNKGEVALTFDDGPNATTTLAVRDLLDGDGVKGTFFSVGKAVEQRPDISRALVADGQLVGNHSFHHDSWRWLDPWYPELARTEHVVAALLGVCPAFYRPPHGQHDPFMAHVVSRAGMQMVTWDVSAGDWATTDADLVARRVLSQVRPGSIIVLHDGLDGHVNVDRTVVVRALPKILAGLRQRGLKPVRLDVLLGAPGYLAHC
jgi:peptidoglycan/xylan/chitin deacetylase (PgdA/CDA1 family)